MLSRLEKFLAYVQTAAFDQALVCRKLRSLKEEFNLCSIKGCTLTSPEGTFVGHVIQQLKLRPKYMFRAEVLEIGLKGDDATSAFF